MVTDYNKRIQLAIASYAICFWKFLPRKGRGSSQILGEDGRPPRFWARIPKYIKAGISIV